MPGKGVDVGGWLVEKASGFLDARFSRRGFIARSTMMGTAVAASGGAVITRPGTAYAFVQGCPSGSLCNDGYTEFCCVINAGVNACPPNTAAAGWWRADSSVYCFGGTRYYIDCNNWSGAGPCRCAAGCDTRKVYCNHFRYGQCNQQISGTGVIACRMVTCTPPYQIAGLNCVPSGAVDNSTSGHNADCAKYAPPPPPPPIPVPVALPVVSAVTDGAGGITVVARGSDGAVWLNRASAGSFGSWESLGAAVVSQVVIATYGAGQTIVAAKDTAGHLTWTVSNGVTWTPWAALEGVIASDPVLVSTGADVVLVVRGTNGKVYTRTWNGSAWTPWVFTEGTTNSDPAAVLDGGTVLLAARGLDRQIHMNRIAGGAFQGWRSGYAGVITSDPVMIPPAAGAGGLLIARGDNYKLYLRGFGGASPSTWQSLPNGSFTSEGALALVGSERHAFGRGNGGQIFWSRNVSGSWSSWNWQPLGDIHAQARPVAIYDGTGLVVLALAGDKRLWYQRWNGTSWNAGWTQVPGLIVAPAKGYK